MLRIGVALGAVLWKGAAEVHWPESTPSRVLCRQQSEAPSPLYTERSNTPLPGRPHPVLNARRSALLGVEVDEVTESQVIDHVSASSLSGKGGTIFSVNLDTLRQAHKREEIFSLLDGADLRIADGMPILWAGAAAGTPFPERVAGSSLVPKLARRAAKDGLSVYLLGGNEGAAAGAADILQAENPGLDVAGTDCPAFGFERSESEMAEIRERATKAQPDIVFVGLGFPKQEHLIEDLRRELPNAWFVSCGITFSFIVGEVRRAPRWMQRLGLEWLHRLTQEPKRLFRRYIIEDLPFLVTLMRSARRQRAAARAALAAEFD